MIRVDLHTHTHHSLDAVMSPRELVERTAEEGLDRVAVTDHGEIDGALEARALDPDRIIVGEEIRCRCRTEVIGLFLQDRIPDGLSVRETVERIRDQGGLIYAPHPFAYLRSTARRAARALRWADAAEVVNARAFVPGWNRLAASEASRRDLPACGSSDAHFPRELGRASTRLPAFRTVEEFRAVLGEARPVLDRHTGPWLHVASATQKGARLTGRAVSRVAEDLYGRRRALSGGPASG